MPIPKGTVRVFKQDQSDNSLQFIGEDSVNHTPKDENITLTIGNAFDIKADLIAKDRTQYGSGGYRANLVLTIINHKDIAAEIEVVYNTYYGDNLSVKWEDSNSAKPDKISSS